MKKLTVKQLNELLGQADPLQHSEVRISQATAARDLSAEERATRSERMRELHKAGAIKQRIFTVAQRKQLGKKLVESWIGRLPVIHRPKFSDSEKRLYRLALEHGPTFSPDRPNTPSWPKTAEKFGVVLGKLRMYANGKNLKDIE